MTKEKDPASAGSFSLEIIGQITRQYDILDLSVNNNTIKLEIGYKN